MSSISSFSRWVSTTTAVPPSCRYARQICTRCATGSREAACRVGRHEASLHGIFSGNKRTPFFDPSASVHAHPRAGRHCDVGSNTLLVRTCCTTFMTISRSRWLLHQPRIRYCRKGRQVGRGGGEDLSIDRRFHSLTTLYLVRLAVKGETTRPGSEPLDVMQDCDNLMRCAQGRSAWSGQHPATRHLLLAQAWVL